MSKYIALKTADRNGYIHVAEKDWQRLGILNHERDYNNKIKGLFSQPENILQEVVLVAI